MKVSSMPKTIESVERYAPNLLLLFQNQFKKSFPSLSREKMEKFGPRFNAGNGRVRG